MQKKTFIYAFKSSLPILAGYIVLGMGFGILLHSRGYGVVWALAMSAFIYAGSMQYVTIDLMAGGASLVVAAIMALTVNIRHLFYGITMLEKYKDTRPVKPYLIFALTDETFSLVCTPNLPWTMNARDYYFWVSLLNQSYWIIGSVLGNILGNFLPFPTTGIEFSMTALFLIILINQWEVTKEHKPVLTGVVISVVCLLIFGRDNMHAAAIITVAALVTIIIRALPFLVFQKSTPEPVLYLGRVLPYAVMGMLVVYCLKDVTPFTGSHGMPELIACLLVFVLHKWKHNTLLSMVAGTVCYMVLVQRVFV